MPEGFLGKANGLDRFHRAMQRRGTLLAAPGTSLRIATSQTPPTPSQPQSTSIVRVVDDVQDQASLLSPHETLADTKLGTFVGVFVPVCLSIWGVVVFLRFGFIIAQAGLLGTLGLFTAGYIITTTTALSVSAISTNGTVRGGGAYFMISRTLGPEFGGSVGLIFSFGTCLTGIMNLLGFIEPILSSFGADHTPSGTGLPEGRWWSALYNSAILALCTILCLAGAKWVSKGSLGLAVILAVATTAMFGSLLFTPPIDDSERRIRFTSWSWETLQGNLLPRFTSDLGIPQTVQTVFSVVFPACTGILTGASMSGDLQNPGKAIPKGTLSAVGFTYFLYAVLAIFVSATVDRQSLYDNLSILQDVTFYPPLVTTGILASCLYVALASIIGAANMVKAIAMDQLLPYMNSIGNPRDPEAEPLLATILVYAIMQLCVLFATDINTIAPFVTMASLLTFGVINLACFLLKAASTPNFRPTFAYFTWQSAAVGLVGCFAAMFFIDGLFAFLSCALAGGAFALIHFVAPPKSWGDVTQSLIYHQVRKYLLRLDSRKDNVKFWRPQILLLVRAPLEQEGLVRFMNDLKKGGLFVLGHVIKGDFQEKMTEYKRQLPAWLRFVDLCKIKAFTQLTIAETERQGVQQLLLGSGLGGMKPNIVVMGLLDLQRCPAAQGVHASASLSTSTWVRNHEPLPTTLQDELLDYLPHSLDFETDMTPQDYVGIIEDVLSMNKAIAITRGFRGFQGVDATDATREVKSSRWSEEYKRLSNFVRSRFSRTSLSTFEESPLLGETSAVPQEESSPQYIDLWPIQVATATDGDDPNGMATFSFDTYTMVLQLGCILHMVKAWKVRYRLRVMVFVENEQDAAEEQARVESLLLGLRITATVKMVWLSGTQQDGDSQEYNSQKCRIQMARHLHDRIRHERRQSMFVSTRLSRPLVARPGHGRGQSLASGSMPEFDSFGPYVSPVDVPAKPESIFETLSPLSQHKIINELMQKHSSSQTTQVIFTTLRQPDPETSQSHEASLKYLHNLEVLTAHLPPTVLVHGKTLTVTMAL